MGISVLVVVKNQESLLKNCLESVKDIGELIVLDLGSTDNSPSVAKQYTEKVYHFSLPMTAEEAWNEALKKATGDTVFYLHPYEMVSPESAKLLTTLEGNATCIIRHYTNDASTPGWKAVTGEFPFAGYFESRSLRVFTRGPEFSGAISPLIDIEGKSSSVVIHQFKDWSSADYSLKKLPEDQATIVAIGISKQKEGDLVGAAALYEGVLSSGVDMKAMINLSYCYLHMGKLDEAKKVIESALLKFPKNASLLNNLTTYFIFKKDYNSARETSLLLLASDPHNFSCRMNVGYLDVVDSLFIDAVKQYTTCVTINPKSIEARMNLALALLKNEEKENAKIALQELLELDPNHEGAKELLSKL